VIFFLVGTNLCFNSLFIFVFPLETQLSKEKAMCLSTKSGHRFSWVYMSFFVFIEMCLIDFVDIGGIRLTRRVPLVEQELPTLPEHLSSSPVFSGVRVTQSLVLYVCFVDRCLSFCAFSFGHCVVCSSSIYGLWLPLWYLQTLLIDNHYLYFLFLNSQLKFTFL